MTVTIGAQALGSAWCRMTCARRYALELRHLDIGAGEQIDDGGPRHAHHVGDDDERQGQRRQRRSAAAARGTACRR